ncbi:hypothetical protein [Streptomyces yaizuensis]|uniref:Uncharacterized protein n=1 Tax=Streptomyces yaizuensis TaxID=2989713 RepID=A0ABQ5PAP5_9ACTN|nr:hypothetical protein [Streptomyces sp. YSPA8]GLF99622.1 hypothetical protein SYYSPA8_35015 [Streptomyces sp. YSPA8]
MNITLSSRRARTGGPEPKSRRKVARVAGAFLVAAATVATTALTAAPAAAQDVRPMASWELWNSVIGPEDRCTPTTEYLPLPGVFTQTCALKNSSGGYGQAALIVVNHRSAAVEIVGDARLVGYNSFSSCNRSPLSVGIRVVCFSPTVPVSGQISAVTNFAAGALSRR